MFRTDLGVSNTYRTYNTWSSLSNIILLHSRPVNILGFGDCFWSLASPPGPSFFTFRVTTSESRYV